MLVKLTCVAVVLCLFVSALAIAQSAQSSAPSGAAPAPSQQQLAMGYFGGYWKITGTTKISPSSPAAQFTAKATGEWIPGNYFLEIKYINHGPLGDVHTVRMMEYNSSEGVYTFNEYNSMGEHVVGIGKIDGQKWVWQTTKKMNGIVTKGRYITTFVTADAYSYKSEIQNPGGGWVTITEGTATRTPPPQD
jgi:hypothetical protein